MAIRWRPLLPFVDFEASGATRAHGVTRRQHGKRPIIMGVRSRAY